MIKENISGAQALAVQSDVTSAADCESAVNAALSVAGLKGGTPYLLYPTAKGQARQKRSLLGTEGNG
jgi:hypothetical protein